VIKQHFIVIVVVVIKRHFQCTRVGFDGPRAESANHETVADKGGMGRRGQVIAVAHQRPDIAPIDLNYGVVAVPAHRIQRVKREGHHAHLFQAFDMHLPAVFILLGFKGIVNSRVLQHRRIKHCMRPQHTLVGQAVSAVAVFDNQHLHWLAYLQSPGGAAGNHHVVAIAHRQLAIIAIQFATAFVQEQQVIAIAVTNQVLHGVVQPPEAHAHIIVVQ